MLHDWILLELGIRNIRQVFHMGDGNPITSDTSAAFSGQAWAGRWSQTLKLGVTARHANVGCRHFNHYLKCCSSWSLGFSAYNIMIQGWHSRLSYRLKCPNPILECQFEFQFKLLIKLPANAPWKWRSKWSSRS